ncbi:MAG: MltA domain-containing protein [Sphingomonadaceae bacterium]|uniref:MltA domain-containing protein n=1 Tax=Thermaurantiacus sp. TaxID=2820283 RepID=UPI00298F149C|nr:MltA domain-containing protein [Thermaurantiacus sp.]MCS6985929.1 MltA domain-containing protein [Sphingomonadaceae bacterium]MDW8414855.1 MltA domain-containing protein [Thermaurantiacus sp.]
MTRPWYLAGALASLVGCTVPTPQLVVSPSPDNGTAALEAFRAACPHLLARTSPHHRSESWQAPCATASKVQPAAFGQFLNRHFRPVTLGDGRGLATGYFLPELPAHRAPAAGLDPVLGPPRRPCAPCPPRAAIRAGALQGLAPVLAWMDPVDLFVLQVQGSGVVRFDDGERLRLSFAGHNGHAYVGVGAWLRAGGAIPPGSGLDAIRAWLERHPHRRDELLNRNPRWVFFRVVGQDEPFPVGALGSPLVPWASVAVDPAHMPMGAMVEVALTLDGQPVRRFLVAADAGAAIRGPNRLDIFTGHGPEAERTASRLQVPARVRIWLPKGAS